MFQGNAQNKKTLSIFSMTKNVSFAHTIFENVRDIRTKSDDRINKKRRTEYQVPEDRIDVNGHDLKL